jgi:hypothetical protein
MLLMANEPPLRLGKQARNVLAALTVAAACFLCGCQSLSHPRGGSFSRFKSFDNSPADWAATTNTSGARVLLSGKIPAGIPWNELIVSWNATAPDGTFLKVEAAAISGIHQTKFYTMGLWSLDGNVFPRTSVPDQADADGTVDTDTLVLNHPADAAQLRVTLGGTNGAAPTLKFIGLSFANTKAPAAAHPPNRAAWGRDIPTPERSQHGYPGQNGWCSPAALSMVLSRWAEVLHRPELNLPVPQVAAAVYDRAFNGTGNWPFNTAFAGSFDGMRAYVTRFNDLSEVENWIAAGIPVILSARWDWLEPGRPLDRDGHLIVCIGFTASGDVIVNDPASRPGEPVRRIYQRANVIHAWSHSHNTVYLVYPDSR